MKELLAKLAKIDADLDTLLKHDELTDEQRAEHDKLVDKRAKVAAKITAEKDRVKREQERAQLEADEKAGQLAIERRDRGNPGRITNPDVPGPRATNTIPAETRSVPDRNHGFRHHREFLLAVMQQGLGRRVDPRLEELRAPDVNLTAGSDEQRGDYDPYGGFLVPEGFLPDFLEVRPEDDPMAAYITGIPMQRPIVRIPARTDKNHTTSVAGGLTVTRRPQTVAGTPSQMTMEQVVLEATSLFGLAYATEELLADSPLSFVALLDRGFRQQFVYQLINERLTGTGAGEFLGILNALDSASNGPTLSITKETGQQTKTVVYENVLKMRAQCWGYQDAIWIANHDVLPQLALLNQSVGTGGTPVWIPGMMGGARQDIPDVLLGRPLFFSEYAQTLGTSGDIICGNWREYLEGTYQPQMMDMSVHVRFVNHERTFKFWMRNAGAPWWKSALTPKYSSSKLSPFTILGTR